MSSSSSLKNTVLSCSYCTSLQKNKNERKESRQIPDDVLFHTATFLDHSTLIGSFFHVNKQFSSISNEIIGSYLKPDLRSTGDVKRIFKNPENRIDKYVPLDKIGLEYLDNLGIRDAATIEDIKKGILTIEEEINNLNLNLDSKLAILNLSPDNRSKFDNRYIRTLIFRNLFAINDIIYLKSFQVNALKNHVVQRHIKANRLTIAEAMSLKIHQIAALTQPTAQEHIESGVATLQQIIDGAGVYLPIYLFTPNIQKHIVAKRLTTSNAKDLNSAQIAALNIQTVHQNIESGKLTVKQVINAPHDYLG